MMIDRSDRLWIRLRDKHISGRSGTTDRKESAESICSHRLAAVDLRDPIFGTKLLHGLVQDPGIWDYTDELRKVQGRRRGKGDSGQLHEN